MEPVISVVFALVMYVNGSMDGHMMTDGLSKCLELRPDFEGELKIYKIIKD